LDIKKEAPGIKPGALCLVGVRSPAQLQILISAPSGYDSGRLIKAQFEDFDRLIYALSFGNNVGNILGTGVPVGTG